MTEKPRETQAESHVVELKEKVNNSSLMKHPYHVAIRTLGLTAQHIDNKRANNRAENSHQPVRRRERKQRRFKSPGSAQRFLNIQAAVYNTFYLQRHLCNRLTFKRFRKDAFNVWESASAAA